MMVVFSVSAREYFYGHIAEYPRNGTRVFSSCWYCFPTGMCIVGLHFFFICLMNWFVVMVCGLKSIYRLFLISDEYLREEIKSLEKVLIKLDRWSCNFCTCLSVKENNPESNFSSIGLDWIFSLEPV